MFKTNSQPHSTQLFFGQTEWMLVQAALDPKTQPAFAQHINPALSPDELRGALIAAREGLMARDWIREDEQGRVEINPVLQLCWRSVTSPRKSLAMTLIEPGHPTHQTRQIFYNQLDQMFIGNWVQPNRACVFDLTEDAAKTSDNLIQHWFGKPVSPEPKPSALRSYQVSGDVMPATLSEPTLAEFAKSLQKAGVAADDAQEIESLYSRPTRRASLILASDENKQVHIHAMVWLSQDNVTWLVTDSKTSPTVTLQRVTPTQLAAHITAFVAWVNN